MTEGEAPTSRITSLCKEIGWLKIQILTSKKNGDETVQAELQARLNALLTEHTQLQREQANYDIGETVECRDGENEEWQHGVVTSVRPLLVRPIVTGRDLWNEAFEWQEVRKSKATLQSLEERQVKQVLEDIAMDKDNYEIGNVVECRDGKSEEWQHGVVTSVRPLLVRPVGFTGAFEWEEVRRSKATLQSLCQGKRELEDHIAQIQLEIQMTQDTDASPDPVEEEEPQLAEEDKKPSPSALNGTRLRMKQNLESASDSGRLDQAQRSDLEAETIASPTAHGEAAPAPNLVQGQERVESPLPFVETVANAVAAAEAACKRCGVRTPSFRRNNGSEEVSRREQRSPMARRQQVHMQRNDVHMQQRNAIAKSSHIGNSREHSVEIPRSSSRGGNNKQSQAQMSQLFDTLNRQAQASSKEQRVLEHRARQLDKSLRSVQAPGTRVEREKAAEKAARAEQQNAGSARKKAAAELLKLKNAFDARLQKLSERDRSPDPTAQTPAITPQRSRLAPGQRMQTSTAMFDHGVASLPAAKKVSWGSQLAPAMSKPGRINADTRSEAEAQRISARRKGSKSPARYQTKSQQAANDLAPSSVSPSIENTPSSVNAFVWRQHSAGSAAIDDGDDDNTSDHLDSLRDADFSGEQGLEAPAVNAALVSESNTSCDIEASRDQKKRSNSISLDIGPGTASEGSFVPLYTSDTELCTLPSTPAIASRSVPVMQADVSAASHGSRSVVHTVYRSCQLRNALEAVAGDSANREDRLTRGNELINIETSMDSDNTNSDVIQSGGDADGGGGSPLFVAFPQRWGSSEINSESQNEISGPPRSWGTTSVGESVSMEDEEEESRSPDEIRTNFGIASYEYISEIVEAPVESLAAAAATTAAYANTVQGSQPLRRQWSPPPANRLSTPVRSNKPASTSVTLQIDLSSTTITPPAQRGFASDESSLVERAFGAAEVVEVQARRSLSSGGRRSQEVFSRLAGSHTASSQARQDEISIRSSRRVRNVSSPPRGSWQH